MAGPARPAIHCASASRTTRETSAGLPADARSNQVAGSRAGSRERHRGEPDGDARVRRSVVSPTPVVAQKLGRAGQIQELTADGRAQYAHRRWRG